MTAAQPTLWELPPIQAPEVKPRPPRRSQALVVAPQMEISMSLLPATRGACVRLREDYAACPWLTCRHHLWHRRAEDFAKLLDHPPEAWPQTCSLDVADAVDAATPGGGGGDGDTDEEGSSRAVNVAGVGSVLPSSGLRLTDVGAHLGISGERARQIARDGIDRARDRPASRESLEVDGGAARPVSVKTWARAQRFAVGVAQRRRDVAPELADEPLGVGWFGGHLEF